MTLALCTSLLPNLPHLPCLELQPAERGTHWILPLWQGYADVAAGVVDASTSASSASFRIYMNDGSAGLQMPTTIFPSWFWQEVGIYPPMWIKTIAAGDIDGDGDIDLVTTQEGSPVLYNNGGGGFTAPALPPSSSPANGQVACSSHLSISAAGSACWGVPLLADVDNDGDVDLVFAKSSAYSEIFLNTKGTLQRSGITSTGTTEFYGVDNSLASTISYLTSISGGDIDNDGDLDLIASSSSGQSNGRGLISSLGPFCLCRCSRRLNPHAELNPHAGVVAHMAHFCPKGGRADNGACFTCPSFSVRDALGDRCEECAANFVSDAGGTTCVPCPAGQDRALGLNECVACPIGKSTPGAGATCTDCQPGSYADTTGLKQCPLCAVGSYQPTAGTATSPLTPTTSPPCYWPRLPPRPSTSSV